MTSPPTRGGRTCLLIDYPLKQGLKHTVADIVTGINQLLIDYPLKQGLKPRSQRNFSQ